MTLAYTPTCTDIGNGQAYTFRTNLSTILEIFPSQDLALLARIFLDWSLLYSSLARVKQRHKHDHIHVHDLRTGL
jgi:hypothetical protein